MPNGEPVPSDKVPDIIDVKGKTEEGWTIDDKEIVDPTKVPVTEDTVYHVKTTPEEDPGDKSVPGGNPDPTPGTHTVTFVNTDGTITKVPVKDGDKVSGTKVPTIKDLPGRDEKGWTKDGEAVIDPTTATIKENTTCYVKTEPEDEKSIPGGEIGHDPDKWVVTFVNTDGTATQVDVADGETVPAAEIPSIIDLPGRTEDGWTRNGTLVEDPETVVIHDNTVFFVKTTPTKPGPGTDPDDKDPDDPKGEKHLVTFINSDLTTTVIKVKDGDKIAKANGKEYTFQVEVNTTYGSDAGNITRTKRVSKKMNVLAIKLFDFRVAGIADPTVHYDGQDVYVPHLAFDRNNTTNDNLMKKGYSFNFKLTSMGLKGDTDEIRIRPTFYGYNEATGKYDILLDVYYKNDSKEYTLGTYNADNATAADDTFRLYSDSTNTSLLGTLREIRLNDDDREISGKEQTWSGRYGVPSTALFVKKGQPLTETNLYKGDVLIRFDIDAMKNNASKYNYLVRGQWAAERVNDAGSLIDSTKGIYEDGSVIVIDGTKNALDALSVFVALLQRTFSKGARYRIPLPSYLRSKSQHQRLLPILF